MTDRADKLPDKRFGSIAELVAQCGRNKRYWQRLAKDGAPWALQTVPGGDYLVDFDAQISAQFRKERAVSDGHPIPDECLNAHTAIIGKTGSGKSYTARGLVERLLEMERRVVILDPVGVWYGLRADHNGFGNGFPIAIFGGEYADKPVSEGAGRVLGKTIGSNRISAIIDTSEMGVNERERFQAAFLDALYTANRQALWLVLEEADEAAPQSARHSPHSAKLLNAVDRITRRGRSKGFRLISITQRPAVLHKNVLTQTQTLVAHRLPSPQDRTAIKHWVDGVAYWSL